MAGARGLQKAAFLRVEQRQRYESSDIQKESAIPRNPDLSSVKFKKECIFLAECANGDLEEMKKLLDQGIDINTQNIDGLTALHQACIYQKLNVVKFLVEHLADVNTCDNDGWTPLHAASSSGCIDVARYLIENGSRLDAVAADGELLIDVADGDEMRQFISAAMEKQGIDVESLRKREEQQMLDDANHLLKSGTYDNTLAHPKTGATPLHVAAARGYVNVIRVLLQAGADINATDLDGWTPMHAAAHWGQREACHLLVENLCDLTITDSLGLLAQDVAHQELEGLIESLAKKQKTLYSEIRNSKRASFLSKKRSSVSRLSFDQKQTMLQKTREEERSKMPIIFGVRTNEKLDEEEQNGERRDPIENLPGPGDSAKKKKVPTATLR